MPHWLRLSNVPLFVSRRTLIKYKTLPRSITPWSLDSGGFTELSMFGGWQLSALDYAAIVRRFRDEIGLMDWAAPQDWMCEPPILKKTGKSVRQHQDQTLRNYLELRSIDTTLPIIPVIQGWQTRDYLDHIDDYARAGIDLTALNVVGLGSVCRRQGSQQIIRMVHAIHDHAPGIRLHGFGFKTRGLLQLGEFFESADSLSWSFQARMEPPLDGCVGHINCANCFRYAHQWRDQLMERLRRSKLDR